MISLDAGALALGRFVPGAAARWVTDPIPTPVLFVKDLPPSTTGSLKITRPQIYYGWWSPMRTKW
jgi:hypothetical protein